MSGKIYLISKDGQPKYVGFTTQSIEERWSRHCECSNTKKYKLYNAIRKYGKDAFTVELIGDYINEEFALTVCEEFWIRHLGTHVSNGGYNMTYGGEGMIGYKHSPETKAKIGAANKKRQYKSASVETKSKMSKSRVGKVQSIETKQKRSETIKQWWAKRKANEN